MVMKRAEKLKRLEKIIRGLGPTAIAFSGGADSSFLAAVAKRILGGNALLVTVVSPFQPRTEKDTACRRARQLGMPHILIRLNPLRIRGFAHNPPNRCYLCKKSIFSRIIRLARQRGFLVVCDGTNADDAADYRPGSKAAVELGIRSPLQEAELGKNDILAISRAMKLSSAGKPSMACLASRFPYGTIITRKALSAVDKAEEGLRNLGFREVRVRYHGDVARIEVARDEMWRMSRPEIRRQAAAAIHKAGFAYVALDLDGYRTGSMNDVLPDSVRLSGRRIRDSER